MNVSLETHGTLVNRFGARDACNVWNARCGDRSTQYVVAGCPLVASNKFSLLSLVSYGNCYPS